MRKRHLRISWQILPNFWVGVAKEREQALGQARKEKQRKGKESEGNQG